MRPSRTQRNEGGLSWFELTLILVLIVIVLAIAIELFGPYIRLELARLCAENNLPCEFLQ